MNTKLYALPDGPTPHPEERPYSLEELADQLDKQRERMPLAKRRRFDNAFWSSDRRALTRYSDVARGTIFETPVPLRPLRFELPQRSRNRRPRCRVRAAARRGATRAGPEDVPASRRRTRQEAGS